MAVRELVALVELIIIANLTQKLSPVAIIGFFPCFLGLLSLALIICVLRAVLRAYQSVR